MRHFIFYAHSNGLAESGGIVRIGRKVLVDEEKFVQGVLTSNGGKN
jgi:hypothetical protein